MTHKTAETSTPIRVGSLALTAAYSSPEQEIQHLHNAALVLDHDCDWLEITGTDSADFLHRMLTRSTRDMKIGESRQSWLLDSGGKIISSLTFVLLEANRFAAAIHKAYATAVYEALDKYLIMEDTTLKQRDDWTAFSVEGENLPAELLATTTDDAYKMQRTFSGLSGFTLFGPRKTIEKAQQRFTDQGLKPVGYIALNAMRLANFCPVFDADMKPQTNPLIYGSELDFIDSNKGCYIGQETVAMTRDRGRPPSRLVLLSSDVEVLQEDIVMHDGKAVGNFLTHAFDAKKAQHLAFAVIKHRPLENGFDTFYDAQSQAWQVQKITQYKVV